MEEDNKGVTVTIEGVAAAREPRSAAEDFRQMLLEQLGQSYHDVKVEFKTLEDVGEHDEHRWSCYADGPLHHRRQFQIKPALKTHARSRCEQNEKMNLPKLNGRPNQKTGPERDGFRLFALCLFHVLPWTAQQKPPGCPSFDPDVQHKMDTSKSEMQKATNLERQAKDATGSLCSR